MTEPQPDRADTTIAAPVRALLTEIAAALDLPYPADGNKAAYHRVMVQRVGDVLTSVQGVLAEGDPVFDADYLRKRTAANPVTYRTSDIIRNGHHDGGDR